MKDISTQTQPANPLFDGLKQLVREAVREELESTLMSQKQRPEKLLFDTKEAAKILNVPATWLAQAAREAGFPLFELVITYGSRELIWKHSFSK